MQRPVDFVTSDGLRLEGRLLEPEQPQGAVVVCHPHPLMDGSMSSLLIPTVQRAIAAAGLAALRFNFRGVGRSQGSYDHGRSEQEDVRAALAFFADRYGQDVPLAVVGWSFGALVGLAAAAGDPRVTRYVAIAPPVGVDPRRMADLGIEPIDATPPPDRLDGWKVRALAVVGTRDQVTTPEAVRAWATEVLGDRVEVEVIDDADHLFNRSQGELGERVATFVTA